MGVSVFSDRLGELMNEKKFPVQANDHLLIELRNKKERLGYLSAPDIGKIVGASAQAVLNWLNSPSTVPHLKYIHKLSDAFGVSVEWILGQSDVPHAEKKEVYGVFSEYGFSAEAFQVLDRLKEQGENMETLMRGLNAFLAYYTTPYDWLSEVIKDATNDLESEDDEGEKELLRAEIEFDSKREAKIAVPALNSLNSFFDLFSNGMIVQVPIQTVLEEQRRLTEEGKGVRWHKLLMNTIYPAQSDSAALFEVETALRDAKKQLIKKELKRIKKLPKKYTEQKEIVAVSEEFGFLSTQQHALEQLDLFYNSGECD